MRPATEFSPEQLVGKHVFFRSDEDHAACWHAQMGLRSGVVRRVGQSLAQKAALLGTEGIELPQVDPDAVEAPRLWVWADGCERFPRGCEAAVEIECLLVEDS